MSRIIAVVYERKTVIPADGRSVPAQVRNDHETTQIDQIFKEFENNKELGEWVMDAESSGLKYRAFRCQPIKVTNKVEIHP